MRYLLPLLLLACDAPATAPHRVEVDEGTACLTDDDRVRVDFHACLSSSCDTLVSATCAAAVEGGDVVVHAEAVIERRGEECTMDCGQVRATCPLPDARPDDPTLVFGDQHVAFAQAVCPDGPF